MRILIADDDPATLRLLDARIRRWGYETVLAHGGNEAWNILRAPGAPALVLLDWMMPDLDGIQLCRNVRSLQAELRPYIILLTARETKKDLVTGINAGADDYLTKPFEPDELRVRLHAGARIVDMEIDMLTARETLRHMATHDDMTGLLNRVFGMETLSREFARSARTGRPISIVLADLDQFKAINDSYGHASACRALVQTTKRLSSKIRPYDILVRYGRKEFMAVLYECDAPDAGKIAERLRRVLADEPVDVAVPSHVEAKKTELTASFGVASCSEARGAAIEDLLRLADKALCRAKTDGRNRVNVEQLLLAASKKDEPAMMAAG